MTIEALSLQEIDAVLDGNEPITKGDAKVLVREFLTRVKEEREDYLFRGVRWFRHDDPEVSVFSNDEGDEDDEEFYL